MKTRVEVAKFINYQLEEDFNKDSSEQYECKKEKGRQWHYGIQELRELLDFIYEKEPETEEEKIYKITKYKPDK